MPGPTLSSYVGRMTEQVETIIVGGGQAGLAVGYHLAQRHRSFVILDANERTGDSWRKRWDSLQLFTPAYLNALPGLEFPGPRSHCPTKDEMADYLEAYATKFDLPVRLGMRVDAVTRNADRFVVTANDHEFEADNVVLATGGYHSAYVPDFADQLDAGIMQLHSSEYRTPTQLRDGDVLVVGAANSGAEIALEASAAHRTWLSGRHPGQRAHPSREQGRPGLHPTFLVLHLPDHQRDQPDRAAAAATPAEDDASASASETPGFGRRGSDAPPAHDCYP